MKAVLEFQLPEDKDDFECASKANDLFLTIFDLDQFLRERIKYATDQVPQEAIQSLQEVRDHLYNLLEERRLSLEMLS